MNKILYIVLISLFSFTIISCAKEEEKKEGPVLTEVYPVTTPTDDPSPNYTFSSTKAELSLMEVHVHQGQPLPLVGTTQSPFLP